MIISIFYVINYIMSADAIPLHSTYEHAWALAGEPNPSVLHDYLTWLTEDNDRFKSAASSMQWFPPGFNSFLVARQTLPDGSTARSIQLNFYHQDYPGNEEPHGHSRNAKATWYAHPGMRQVISRYAVLDADAPEIEGVDVDEYAAAGNCIVDLKDGRRPLYHPVDLGSRLLVRNSVTDVATLGSQLFNSTEVHHVGFEGRGVAISAHFKGPEEVPTLSESKGLVHYKGLSPEEAEKVLAVRGSLARTASGVSSDTRLGPITMMYGSADTGISVESSPTPTSPETAEMLILGAIRTAERLKKLV